EAEQVRDDDLVASAGNGQELRQSLDDAQNHRLSVNPEVHVNPPCATRRCAVAYEWMRMSRGLPADGRPALANAGSLESEGASGASRPLVPASKGRNATRARQGAHCLAPAT